MQGKPSRPVINRAHPVARGLVGAWPMWERGGVRAGDIARGQTGSLTAGVAWGRGPSPGTLWDTNCEDDSLDCGTLFQPRGSAGITAAVWVRPDGTPTGPNSSSYSSLLSLDSATLGGTPVLWLGRYDTAPYNACWFVTDCNGTTVATVSYQYSAANTAVVGAWYHVVGVRHPSGNVTLYVNGRLPTLSLNLQNTTSIDANTYRTVIGAQAGWLYRGWEGLISDVRLWSRALTAQEIGQLYARPWELYHRRPLCIGKTPAAAVTSKPFYFRRYVTRRAG